LAAFHAKKAMTAAKIHKPSPSRRQAVRARAEGAVEAEPFWFSEADSFGYCVISKAEIP
jgi:hypothetical protein